MKRVLPAILALAAALGAEPPSAIAIRGARIVPVSGPVLERGTVVLRDGLIEAVGENLSPAPDVWIMEGKGLTVYPGLIDALSSWGLPAPASASSANRIPQAGAPPPAAPAKGPEDRPSNTSWLRAADLIQPSDRRLEEARGAGFTSAAVFPTSGIFAGQGAVINLAGDRAGEMVVATPAGLYLSLRSGMNAGFPGSLMGVIAYIRQSFLDAGHYRAAQAAYQRTAAMKRPAYDRAVEGLLDCPRVLLPAGRAAEIDRMLRLAAELNLKPVLYGGHEAHRAIGRLRASGAPVLLNLKWPERDREADPEQKDSLQVLEFRDKAPSSAAALARAGLPFAFYSGGVERPRDLRKAVKKAIDAGLAPADALKALTLGAAAIYGVSGRLGSLEPGKIANLVVTDGDLFEEKTKIRYVFVDGVKFEPAVETPGEAAR
ncbi:MAG: amidohydrolase family protein [Bryobacterales bacterium]|nr:amidohydrolase family protein [Bryobacterales bacterium]